MRTLALLFGLIASSVSAQDYNPHVYIGSWYQMGGGRFEYPQITPKLRTTAKRPSNIRSLSAQQAAPLPIAGETSQLGFTVSPRQRQANYASFLARSRRADPAGAAGLAETLRSDPIARMEPELAKVGLRVDNVADAYSVYWVEAWQAVHGTSGASSRATAQAVRQQAASAILATPEFVNATPAQKQEFAEALLIQALLVGAAKEQAGGDPAQLAKVSAAVEQGARATGLDLRAMTLTEEGFGPARKTGAAGPAPGAEPQAFAATGDAGSHPSYGFLAAASGAGLGAVFLMGKVLGRKG